MKNSYYVLFYIYFKNYVKINNDNNNTTWKSWIRTSWRYSQYKVSPVWSSSLCLSAGMTGSPALFDGFPSSPYTGWDVINIHKTSVCGPQMASLLYYDDCTYLSPFLKARKILSTCSGCCPQTLPPTRPEEGILGDFPAMTFVRRELRAEESLQGEME